jgi:threonine dehydrogenase-like Zn-dependent dehydrogenase
VIPASRTRFTLEGTRLSRAEAPLAPPSAAQVVIEVAGIALGAEPAAEIAGLVVEAGESATDWIGKRVVVPRVLPCGDCERCRRGRTATCVARAVRDGLASHETVPARFVCSLEMVPPEIDLWRMAALADAAAAPYGALVRAGLAPGETLVVIGDGPRARFARLIAAALGAHASQLDPDSVAAPPPAGARLLETSATAAGQKLALALCPDGGTVIFLDGAATAPVPAPIDQLARKEAQLVCATACHPDLLPELAALMVRHQWPLAELTHAVTASDAGSALEAREHGRLTSLPILRP